MSEKIYNENNPNMRVEIVADHFPINPREDDNAWRLIFAHHNNYELGDEQTDFEDFDRSEYHKVVPVFMYDHSNIALSISPFSCSWDSGQIGYAVMTKEDFKNEFERFGIDGLDCLKGELENYENYINGNSYGVVLQNKCECCDSWTEYDSDWGYTYEDARAEAESKLTESVK